MFRLDIDVFDFRQITSYLMSLQTKSRLIDNVFKCYLSMGTDFFTVIVLSSQVIYLGCVQSKNVTNCLNL